MEQTMARIDMTQAQAIALGILALQEVREEMEADARELAQAVKVLRSMKDKAKASLEPHPAGCS
jgi:hypothetical protein